MSEVSIPCWLHRVAALGRGALATIVVHLAWLSDHAGWEDGKPAFRRRFSQSGSARADLRQARIPLAGANSVAFAESQSRRESRTLAANDARPTRAGGTTDSW